MTYQSLYRRYRSQNFAEIKGQAHITNALRTAVAEGRHSHAYLFSGPRGTGKTSTARVLAKALNCENLDHGEPCGECKSCVDIQNGTSFDLHELDAASNNKVDDIRDLIAKVALGSPGRTKVYILDEVHMLTSGAENALLKTLEEPPPHVVFVLATTEPHKVVPTIRSRTQHFEFKLLPSEDLAEHLRFIIDDAGLDVDDDGIEFALRQGGGSARDTLSALDLVAAGGGVPEGSDIGIDLAHAISNGDPAAAIAAVEHALARGREPRVIGEMTLETLRFAFLASMGAPLPLLNDRTQQEIQQLSTSLGAATITRSLEMLGHALIEMRQAPDPRVPLEVALLRLTRRDGTDLAGLLERIEQLEAQIAQLSAGQPISAPPAAAPSTADAAPIAPQDRDGSARAASPPDHAPPPAPATPQPVAAAPPSAPAQPSAPMAPAPPVRDAAAPPPVRGRAGGPADSARAVLAQMAGSSTEAPAPRAPAEPRAAASSAPAPDPVASPPSRAASSPADASEPAVAPAPTPTPTPAPATGAGAVPSVDLARVEEAMATILGQVSQRARARFAVAQPVETDPSSGVVTFAVPNTHVVSRCEEIRPEIEGALSTHFGGALSIRIIVDDSGPGPSHSGGSTPPPRTVDHPPPDEEDIGDVAELADATDVAVSGIERLTRAFPGSQVIESDL